MGKSWMLLPVATVLAVALGWWNPFHLETDAAYTIAIASFIIFLWITEALPMPVTALLPIVLFPLFGLSTTAESAVPYANPVIFLFMGGFMLGLAIEKWNLHRRIALTVVHKTGTKGHHVVLGFILSTGFLSMWLSNTATTMMMYPIALSVIQVMQEKQDDQQRNLAVCLLLSIAYASNFGGIATLIGTPPNVAYAAFLQKRYDYDFPFSHWMAFGFPIALLLMISLYLIMTKWLFRKGLSAKSTAETYIREELIRLGPLTTPEKRVLIIFCSTAILWVTNGMINTWLGTRFDDNIIALLGALALFVVPAGSRKQPGWRLLQWEDTNKMAWGILLLFGGGISLANQLEKTGVIGQMGSWIAGVAGTNLFLTMLAITVLSIFLSEVMSNVAQVIVFAPVLTGMAEAMQLNPLMLATPMVLAASCASMLPMGTPPNAIVFASGKLTLRDMLKTGLVINLIAIVLITLFCYYLLPMLSPDRKWLFQP